MNEKHLYTLLRVIYKNANINILIREGLSFSKIAELTNEAIIAEFVIQANDKIELSQKGLEKMQELGVKFKKINKEEWIEKDLKSKIPKLDKNFIYLPDQNKLTF
ncbi:MAG: hypothetical protein EHM85_11920 [Desulfobacteraceae bacterium]|nr:MAG: hypothetical protein EHM85_11920 [Desulfobacteraceae bacterium]